MILPLSFVFCFSANKALLPFQKKTILGVSVKVLKWTRVWCVVSDDIFFPSSNLSMVPQVSPDLYGDNNTRLFTYWTVSLLLFLECKIWINDIGWFGGSILFVLPCPIWWLHSLKSIGCDIYYGFYLDFLLFMSPYFLVFLVSSHDIGFLLVLFPFFHGWQQSDAYQATGCYNLLCSGFIQVSSEIAMGASISPVSGYRGSQYDISILVWKVKQKYPDLKAQNRFKKRKSWKRISETCS